MDTFEAKEAELIARQQVIEKNHLEKIVFMCTKVFDPHYLVLTPVNRLVGEIIRFSQHLYREVGYTMLTNFNNIIRF